MRDESKREDAVHSAEEILSHSPKEDEPLRLELRPEIIEILISTLSMPGVVADALNQMREKHGRGRKPVSYSSEIAARDAAAAEAAAASESMYNVLADKIKTSLKDSKGATSLSEGSEHGQMRLIPIMLSQREVDFINDHFLPKKPAVRQIIPQDEENESVKKMADKLGVDEKDYHKWAQDLEFNSTTSGMAVFVDINKAFIQAGGMPRPEFIKFSQGTEGK